MKITHPTPDDLDATLRMAFAHLPPNELSARIEAFTSKPISLDGVFQAKEQERLVGALFSFFRADGAIMGWIPAMLEGRSTLPLFESLEHYARAIRARAILLLADRQQQYDESSLLASGYEYLSDLVHMVVPIQPEEPIALDTGLEFLSLKQLGDPEPELVELVARTYRNSRDFPRLMSNIPASQVLEGYRHDAAYDPEIWFFVRRQGHDLGVLLLTDFPDDQMELTYMGLAQEARGQGLSREIVRFARLMARKRNRAFLLTAADERNTAALKAYLAQGFRAWDRKKVHARFFR